MTQFTVKGHNWVSLTYCDFNLYLAITRLIHKERLGESRVQNYGVPSRSTQPFILLRLLKWVPGISGNLVVKSKLSPRSGSISLRQLKPIHNQGARKFFLKKRIWSWNNTNHAICWDKFAFLMQDKMHSCIHRKLSFNL